MGHIGRKLMFPYIDLEKMMAWSRSSGTADAVKFLGACILIAVVLGAVVLAVVTAI
jgi:hypothetical protein